jgi:hypothetical protein
MCRCNGVCAACRTKAIRQRVKAMPANIRSLVARVAGFWIPGARH